MNRKQKKELRQRQSTRQLMGIVRVTPHGIVTDSGERVFFLIRPVPGGHPGPYPLPHHAS